ncbi:MAG: hypothetical protein L0338_12730, partial [Acidobacteria bacterium]|nr:hypothetical protein [Acidobacteriota bacterium]
GQRGSAFMPKDDPGQFQVSYKAQPGISLERSSEIAQLVKEVRSYPTPTRPSAAMALNPRMKAACT